MDLIDDDESPAAPRGNAHEFTVSEISGAVKRVIEGEFGSVRVRGEVSRVSRPASGHLYFDLKDDRSVISAVSWKGQVARMTARPEEGMEVIATGKLTTFPGQSKYQLIVDNLEPAGAGALMLMLEKRRVALAAEGLFDAGRKRRIPFLPEVIGVVTSLSGAVIRDILHRLRDRFPRQVLIWPVAVQGEKCAAEVAAAIRGFNALVPGGAIARPDLIIVARGGGSIEDLWGFNEEIVVRAAAASEIPLISAVGHETDTTLIDFAADLRAPTPTAAAELAVPVRADLIAWAADQGARMARAVAQNAERRRQRVADLARGLGRPEMLTGPSRQRLDIWAERLGPALQMASVRKRSALAALALRPAILDRFIANERRALAGRAARLGPALERLKRDAAEANARRARDLAALDARLRAAPGVRLRGLRERLAALDRTRATLGHAATLRRGFAVIRAGDRVITRRAGAAAQAALQIEFSDGQLDVVPGEAASGTPARPKTAKPPGSGQGSLF